MPVNRLKAFIGSEAASALPLLGAAILALVLANSPLAGAIHDLLHGKLTVDYGGIGLSKPLLLWINDGLMAVFFLVVGLEIKRELTTGHLADRSAAVLPALAALGGMLVPAVLFSVIADAPWSGWLATSKNRTASLPRAPRCNESSTWRAGSPRSM